MYSQSTLTSRQGRFVVADIGPHPGVVAAKVEARKHARAKRAVLHAGANATAVGSAYHRAADHFFSAVDVSKGMVVAAYLAVGHEFDTRPILRRLAHWGAVSALPIVVGAQAPLEFRAWQPGDPLERDSQNIPSPTEKAEIVQPQILIVPLTAFDGRGVRLGQGGGYYDRTIYHLRQSDPAVRVIGLAFAGQKMEEVPHDALDARLDAVVTEEGCEVFSTFPQAQPS